MMKNLRRKLFYAFIVLIIIPVVLLGSVTFILSFNLTEKKYSEQTELTLKALSQSIEYVLTDMNNLSDSWIANYYLQNILSSSKQDRDNLLLEDPLKIILDERMFRRVLVHHPSIRYALMYNSYGQIFPLYSGNFVPMPYEDFKNHPVYQEVLDKRGLPVWIGPHEYPELTGPEPVLTQIRVIRDLFTLEQRGILFLQVKLSGLEKLFYPFYYNQDDQENQFIIVNDEGLVLLDTQNQLNGSNLYHLFPNQFDKPDRHFSFKQNFNDQESIVSVYNINNYNWKLVSVVPWNSLSKEMLSIMKWVVGISLISLISALLFNLLFVNRVAKSIIRIVRLMRRGEEGDLTVRAQEKGNDETLLLAQGFNSLMGKTSHLLDEIKKEQYHKNQAEMMVLQAQIKPHFLFNTLESINILAIQNEGKKVSQMVYRLGNILRISIQDKEEISIKQEIDHLRNYLEIQKYRFDDLFDFEIIVDDAFMDHEMLKITLQPLVENSIQHGFEGIQYKGFISVRAEGNSNYLVFWIEDNGIGISNEILSGFQYKTDDKFFEQTTDIHGERRGLGVKNVADRLRIHYGASSGIYICSEVNKGTRIKCVIPKYKTGDKHES